MAAWVAVLDACVLYPAPLRDLLLRLALNGLFRARWTERIHQEWMRNLIIKRPDLTLKQLERTRELMNQAVPDALVMDYELLIPELELPDNDDRHVLAAAIRCQAGIIVTFNLDDFPARALSRHSVEVWHPNKFVSKLFDLDPDAVCTAVRGQRSALKNPPKSPRELLDILRVQGLPDVVSKLEPMIDLI